VTLKPASYDVVITCAYSDGLSWYYAVIGTKSFFQD